MSRWERWRDDDAGPLVRPYALTRGRTRSRSTLDVVTLVARSHRPVPGNVRVSPEEERLLGLCREPLTVADMAAELSLPLGVVRVLLDDLLESGLLEVVTVSQEAHADLALLRRVRDELRAL